MKKTSLIAALVLCAAAARAQNGAALAELKTAAGSNAVVANVAVPASTPAEPRRHEDIERATVLCGMDVEYREFTSQLGPIRLWKHLRGTAVIRCAHHRPVALTMHGEGPSLGLGIPNRGVFHSVNGVVAGNLQIRLPAAYAPERLAGVYHNIGGEVLGGGLSFSPWTNTDGSFNATIYLPTSLNASIAVNLTRLEFRIRR